MNVPGFGLRFKTLLIAIVVLWSAHRPQSSTSIELISSTEPKAYHANPYHPLTMECPYPDGTATTLVLASYRKEMMQKPLNSLKNCLEPRVARWTAVI